MKTLSARKIQQICYRGNVNFITPHILYVRKLTKYSAVELSYGNEFFGIDFYGVSICGIDKTGQEVKRWRKLGKIFHSKTEAEKYINTLKRICNYKTVCNERGK